MLYQAFASSYAPQKCESAAQSAAPVASAECVALLQPQALHCCFIGYPPTQSVLSFFSDRRSHRADYAGKNTSLQAFGAFKVLEPECSHLPGLVQSIVDVLASRIEHPGKCCSNRQVLLKSARDVDRRACGAKHASKAPDLHVC